MSKSLEHAIDYTGSRIPLAPDDGLPQPDDTDYAAVPAGLDLGGRGVACPHVGGHKCIVCDLAPTVGYYVNVSQLLRDVPQEPFVFDRPDNADEWQLAAEAAPDPVIICLTEGEQQEAWRAWHAGPVCQDLLRAMAAGETEFGAALATAFLAGIKAAGK